VDDVQHPCLGADADVGPGAEVGVVVLGRDGRHDDYNGSNDPDNSVHIWSYAIIGRLIDPMKTKKRQKRLNTRSF
jgi:hypothetical protein